VVNVIKNKELVCISLLLEISWLPCGCEINDQQDLQFFTEMDSDCLSMIGVKCKKGHALIGENLPRFYGDRIFLLIKRYIEELVSSNSRIKIKLSISLILSIGDDMKEILSYMAAAIEQSTKILMLEFGSSLVNFSWTCFRRRRVN